MSALPDLPEQHHSLLTDPHARLSLTLVLSLLLWSPFGMAVINGQLDVVDAGLRYLVAFLGCRLAVSGITSLIASYRAMQDAEGLELAPAEIVPGRRAEDLG
ncbi:MAG TPA: hypothetical protein VIR58_10455 [Acidimicrobiales bacterium]